MLKHRARILTFLLAIGAPVATAFAQRPARDERPFHVTHYDVALEPRLESRTVIGTVTLSVVVHRDDVAAAGSTIMLDRGGLEIDSVREGDSSRAFTTEQNRSVPAYTFGFAAGAFSEVTDRAGRTALRFLARGFTESELHRIFSESAQMIGFFEQRAGVPYPGDNYAQALVARTAGQEMAGLSIVSEEYGRAVLADPTAIGLLAHELAHQWWATWSRVMRGPSSG